MAKGKKTGGRRAGSLNRATLEARKARAELVDNVEYRASLRERLLAGKLAPPLEAMLWYYAKGKPTERVELSPTVDIVSVLQARRRRLALTAAQSTGR